MERETILVVDDNKEIVYSISELLKYEGYNTVKAYDGMEALKALEEDRIVNGGLVLDKKQRIAIAEGEEVRLTATEYKILLLLMENLGQVFSAEQIYEKVWEESASSGNVELKMERFEVNRLIDQIFADMDDRMKESGLEFITQKTEESTELVSDNMYCYRICQNLLENALKYSAKGTRVFVKTYVKNAGGDARRICLEMTNTAGYFMDFTKEDIVERFARGDKARSSEGNGLGLAIVSTYTKALGGEFDIRIDCDQFRAVVELPAENAGVRSPETVQSQSKAENYIEEKTGKAL